MHPSFASKYKPDLSLFTTLLRQLHHNRASRPKAVSQTENCTSFCFFLRLTHQTLPEFNGFSLHFSPSFPKVKLVYAGHTQNDFKPDSGPSFSQTQQSGAQSVDWLQMTVCPNTPQCGVLVQLLCCSQLSRSLPDLKSWILNMFDMYDSTPGSNGGLAIANKKAQTRRRQPPDVGYFYSYKHGIVFSNRIWPYWFKSRRKPGQPADSTDCSPYLWDPVSVESLRQTNKNKQTNRPTTIQNISAFCFFPKP